MKSIAWILYLDLGHDHPGSPCKQHVPSAQAVGKEWDGKGAGEESTRPPDRGQCKDGLAINAEGFVEGCYKFDQ